MPQLLARPIPELLAERHSLLTPEGRTAAERVLGALQSAPALRFAQPTASLGTWLQQLWLRLGGQHCVDTTARANLDLLWQTLDALPNGELDFCGPALNGALNALTAQPDPSVSSSCGVQLMTIHKSKGLEFEVVIVPELQARSRHSETKLLSWLERGLPPAAPSDNDASDPDDTDITEFLVAPLQFKGSDRSTTKKWVDRVYRDRESQEIRRLLYVAATRAREELHLFAQPACKQDKSSEWILSEPKDSLLATAWPALQSEIEQRFTAWQASQSQPTSTPEPITLDLAASADANLLVMPAPVQPTILHRLPADFLSKAAMFAPSVSKESPRAPSIRLFSAEWVGYDELSVDSGLDTTAGSSTVLFPRSLVPSFPESSYGRHEGNLLSRALGTAVHSLLENLANLRQSNDWPATRAALQQLAPRIAAQIRATGVDPTQSANLAAQALKLALEASTDPTGNWILSPHSEDSTEIRFAGLVSNSLRTVQVDRLFRAGLAPLSNDAQAWWIVDYKTAHADIPDPASALPSLRTLFAPQLETYAKVLTNLHGKDTPIRAALYYPRMKLFDWWEI